MRKSEKFIAHSDDSSFEENVTELLLYRKITKAERIDELEGVLTLDNGIQLVVKGNEGCGGCENGWYYLDALNDCDNAITNVKCVVEQQEYEDVYNIFVFTDDKRINCVQYRGSDNGYYGTGYHLYVRIAEKE